MTALEFNYSLSMAESSLRPFALRLTKDLDEAKDLLQETMMKAFLNKDKFSDGTNLKAWLYTIMKNTFITNYQKMVKRKTFIDNSDNLHYINSSAAITYNSAINAFARERIQKSIDNLDELFKVPFTMYYNGYKYYEIAEYLNLPIGTVKNRIHIARKLLKDKLQEYSHLSVN